MRITENLAVTLLGKPYLENGLIIGNVKRVIVDTGDGSMQAVVEKLSEPFDPASRKLNTRLCATERLFSSVQYE